MAFDGGTPRRFGVTSRGGALKADQALTPASAVVPQPDDEFQAEAILAQAARFHVRFTRLLRRRGFIRVDAEDIVQDFYVRVIRSARSVASDVPVNRWLVRVLKSTMLDYTRRQGADKRLIAKLEATPRADPEADETVCKCLYDLLPQLKPEYAEVIEHIDLNREPRRKVAHALGTSVETLTVRLFRARRALRLALLRTCLTCPIHGFRDCGCREASALAQRRPHTV